MHLSGVSPAQVARQKLHCNEYARLWGNCRQRGQISLCRPLQELRGGVAAEVEVLRVHIDKDLVLEGKYVDPAKWSPLIYNFRHYFRLEEDELGKTLRAEK